MTSQLPKGPGKDEFFIGFLAKWPKNLRSFLPLAALALLVLFPATAFLVGATQQDPGDGGFGGRAEVTGVLETLPYPLLRVTAETDRYPVGTTIILSGQGKRGAQDVAEPLAWQMVTVRGAALKRGDLDMIQLGRMEGLDAPAPRMMAPEQLGRWRLTGEICDGKCLSGAMKPGTGLSHKACANLCLIGGVPPVFVSTGPVEGEDFLLLAGSDGGPVDPSLLDLTGSLITIEGEIERRGTLLVFRTDPATLERAE